MKIVSLALGLCFITGSLTAQSNFMGNNTPLVLSGKNMLHGVANSSVKTGSLVSPLFAKEQVNSLDTLYEYVNRSKSVNVYECYDKNNNAFPITGTNGMFHIVGQKFEISGSAKIVGVLVGFAYKQIFQGTDTNYVLVFGPDPNKSDLPKGNVIAGTRFKVADVDTSTGELLLTPIMFSAKESGTVNGKFNVGVQVYSGLETTDLLAIYSNEQGDGKNEKKAFFSRIVQNGISSENFDHFDTKLVPSNIPNNALPDFDLMIIPILEIGINGIKDAISVNSLCITGAYPNPATSSLCLSIQAKESAIAKISITDIRGNIVETIEKQCSSGDNKIVLSTRDLNSGDYFYIIESDKHRVAGKFNVSK